MGMFDYIRAPTIKCPKCGEPVSGWQSKDGPCDLETLEFYEVRDFHGWCEDGCGAWVTFVKKHEPFTPLSNYDCHVRPKGERSGLGEIVTPEIIYD